MTYTYLPTIRTKKWPYTSQPMFAQLCGVSKSHYRQIEKGDSLSKLDVLNQIGKNLKLTGVELMLLAIEEKDVSPELFQGVLEIQRKILKT
jgi:DNA-binding XRE family transcriptional regulator